MRSSYGNHTRNNQFIYNKGLIMSQQVNMNAFLHSLLVIKKMNNFTVSEAKNALVHEHAEFTDETEARKFIYRQLTRHIEKGLIKRTDSLNGGVKKIIYSKTEKFLASTIVPINRSSNVKKMTTRNASPKVVETVNYKEKLEKELIAHEIDLNASLEEAKEYKRLSERFPELKETLQQYHLQTKDKSIKLLGKVHALQNLLGYSVTGYQGC